MLNFKKSKSFINKNPQPRSPLKGKKKKSVSPGPRTRASESSQFSRSFSILTLPVKAERAPKEEEICKNDNSLVLDSGEKSTVIQKSEFSIMNHPLFKPTNLKFLSKYIPILDRSRNSTKRPEGDSFSLTKTERIRAMDIASANLRKHFNILKPSPPRGSNDNLRENDQGYPLRLLRHQRNER